MPSFMQGIVFDQAMAETYDLKRAELAPMKGALHLLIRLVLSELSADAQILCVGVGTGVELIELAKAFPQWRFTAVEPAVAMLQRCREGVEAAGFTDRCTFHEGHLATLQRTDPFDAATSLLVSHFILDPEERRGFFREVGARLRPGGILVNAELAADRSAPGFDELLEVWLRSMKRAGLPSDPATFGRSVALVPPEEVASILSESGFDTPVPIFQALLIHAWASKRAS